MPIDDNGERSDLVTIIETITTDRKTGLLAIKTDIEMAQIAFKDGMIIGAVHFIEGKIVQLQQYIYRVGIINEVKLDVLSRMREEDGLSFEEVFINGGIIDQNTINVLISFKVKEILLDVLTFDNTDYKFIPGEILYGKSTVNINLSPEDIVNDLSQQCKELQNIAERFSWRQMILVPVNTAAKQPMTRDQFVIYRMVRMPISLEWLLTNSGLGRYRTYRAVFSMLEYGILMQA